MCGIAGMVALADRRPADRSVLESMARAIVHRGPDEEGYFQVPGVGFASRRLSIVGLRDGQQPVSNEDRSVFAVFNGELFDHQELRRDLTSRGHRLTTSCDTEVIPHLWEEYGEGMFDRFRGQFALALYDQRQRRVILARDRFGICPLYWSQQDGWLLFGSEIKALLASGLVRPQVDVRGLDQVFTFFAVPGPATCFAGVNNLLPGHYLDVRPGAAGNRVSDVRYWQMDFPDRGDEDYGGNPRRLADGLEAVLTRAVERRLRADVPVVSYLSGGVDSSLVVALASKLRGEPIPTFTIRIREPDLDETAAALRIAEKLGLPEPEITDCGKDDLLHAYPELIEAAECPVMDPSCASLLLQAKAVNAAGYKVALTGEGADEWLAGYPWLKISRALNLFDLPGLPVSRLSRWALVKLAAPPQFQWRNATRIERAAGGHNAWVDVYGLMSMTKYRLYSPEMIETLGDSTPYDGLGLDGERIARWHPLHQALHLGARVLLPGLLLQAKGDRVAMHSSVETRYPFLDEDVFDFLAPLHPRWKLRGLRLDKYLLRLVAERWLPRDVAWRSKVVFRAPSDSLFPDPAPPFVDQLLSDASLRKTGYFDPAVVRRWREAAAQGKLGVASGMFVRMALAGVVSTQLWHHHFLDGTLADLPSHAVTAPVPRRLVAS